MTWPSSTGLPLVSFVVPTMNSAATLAEALESLATQTWRDFEVIISDGASTDATLPVAERFAARLPSLCIDSRADTGVYDAINRGVQRARGSWFLILGGDDRLHSRETLAIVAPHLQAEVAAQMVYGDVRMMAINQCGVAPGGRHAGPMPLKRLFGANICQQSVFYRRSLFDTLGGFDLRYRLYADWDFNLRAAFLAPTRWIDVVVADYAATGMSATATDTAFLAHLPALLRAELLAHSKQPETWPMQLELLRHANRSRKRGDWRLAVGYFGTYARLLSRRLPVLAQQLRLQR